MYSKEKTNGDSNSLSNRNSKDQKAYLSVDGRLVKFLNCRLIGQDTGEEVLEVQSMVSQKPNC